jgi:hypothetical protein
MPTFNPTVNLWTLIAVGPTMANMDAGAYNTGIQLTVAAGTGSVTAAYQCSNTPDDPASWFNVTGGALTCAAGATTSANIVAPWAWGRWNVTAFTATGKVVASAFST